MVKLPNHVVTNLKAMWFQIQLEELTRSYSAAAAALETRRSDAEDRVREIFGLAPGEVPEFPIDYDGPDFQEMVWEEEQQAGLARTVLRPAFLISYYHLWERHAAKWSGQVGKTLNFSKALEWLQENGSRVDPDALNVVRLAANCAKHGQGDSAKSLYWRRPDLFRDVSCPEDASAEKLIVTDATLSAFEQDIRRAVPRSSGANA